MRSPRPRSRDRESQARIADLGSRLNVALAQRVQELARYRSDFFGRLRQILGNRQDVRIVGDRFVFQSELFFEPARRRSARRPCRSSTASPRPSSTSQRQIPPDIPWVMRVDGHTDARPIATAQFPSNWALSASRAIAVVQYLMSEGRAAAAPRRRRLRRVPAARPRRRRRGLRPQPPHRAEADGAVALPACGERKLYSAASAGSAASENCRLASRA